MTDAAVENDPKFIADISEVFEGAFHSFVSRYLEKVEAYRDVELDEAEKNRLVENIDHLKDLQNYPFQAIELDRTVDEEHVAEVFVRTRRNGQLRCSLAQQAPASEPRRRSMSSQKRSRLSGPKSSG